MNRTLKLFGAILLASTTTLVNAQKQKCAAVSIEKAAIEKDPSIIKKNIEVELQTRQYIKNKAFSKKTTSVITIPVVIHYPQWRSYWRGRQHQRKPNNAAAEKAQ